MMSFESLGKPMQCYTPKELSESSQVYGLVLVQIRNRLRQTKSKPLKSYWPKILRNDILLTCHRSNGRY